MMAKWEPITDTSPELVWMASAKSPYSLGFRAKPNVEKPWLVDFVIAGKTPSDVDDIAYIAFTLHRDDAMSWGYCMEEHDWHGGVIGWNDEGITEPE